MKPRLVLQSDEAAVYEFNGQVFAAKVIKPARQVLTERIVSSATLLNFDIKVFSSGREVDSAHIALYPQELRYCEANADLLGPLLVQALHDDETTLYCIENPRVYKSTALQVIVTTHIQLVRSNDGARQLDAQPEAETKTFDALWQKPNQELQRYILTHDMAAALFQYLKALDLPPKQLLKKVNFFSNLRFASEAIFDRGEIDCLRLRLLRQHSSYSSVLLAVRAIAQTRDHTNVAPLLEAHEWLREDHSTEDSDDSVQRAELRDAIEKIVATMERLDSQRALFAQFDRQSKKQ